MCEYGELMLGRYRYIDGSVPTYLTDVCFVQSEHSAILRPVG